MKSKLIRFCMILFNLGLTIVLSLSHFVTKDNIIKNNKNAKVQINDINTSASKSGVVENSNDYSQDLEENRYKGDIKFVTKQIKYHNEYLRYKINVQFPEFDDTNNPYIKTLNQLIINNVRKQYEWAAKMKFPPQNDPNCKIQMCKDEQVFYTVDIDYYIYCAKKNLISICFTNIYYNLGAAHPNELSFVINYNASTGKIITLSELFKNHSKYLSFISAFCINKLRNSTYYLGNMAENKLSPIYENYKSWNFSDEGISFNFDRCEILACAASTQEVLIPYEQMKELLKPNILY